MKTRWNKKRNGHWEISSVATATLGTALRQLNAVKHAILIFVLRTLVKGNNHYITPNIRTIQKILRERYGICVGIRWLFQCLKDLLDVGLIWRTRRWNTENPEKPLSCSSLIGLTASGVKYLKRSSIAGADDIWQRTLNWWKRKDGRSPTVSELTGNSQQTSSGGVLTSLKAIFQEFH